MDPKEISVLNLAYCCFVNCSQPDIIGEISCSYYLGGNRQDPRILLCLSNPLNNKITNKLIKLVMNGFFSIFNRDDFPDTSIFHINC